MAEWTPNLRASYEQAATTPRLSGRPPTITGRPRRPGLSRCSTEAKKASISICTIFLLLFMQIVQSGRSEYVMGQLRAISHGFLCKSSDSVLYVINLPDFQEKLTVLNQRHHGMHDLRFDDAGYVVKWDGRAYR